MKNNAIETPAAAQRRPDLGKLLTALSTVSGLLFTIHVADDIARGIEAGDLNDLVGGTLITFVWLYGTLVLRGRLAGYIIMFLGGIFGVLVAYSHMRGAGIGEIARSSGGFLFTLTLLLLALTGVFSMILSVHCLWSSQRARSAV